MSAREGSGDYRGVKVFWDDISLVAAKEAARMDKMISCEFNMDNACVELRFADGTMISIDTIACFLLFIKRFPQRPFVLSGRS